MLLLLRLLAFCLLLNLSLTALASNGMSKEELDAHKEFLQLKIESGKELLQKDIEAQGKRLDALDKRIDDQISRVSDIGNAVDRFAVVTGWIALVITGVLALGGLLGYVSVAKKAREEAETVSQKWFNDNQQKLSDRIQELEHAAAHAQTTMDRSVAEVETHKQSAIDSIQKGISAGTGNTREINPEDAEGLRTSVKQLKEKPEASYSYSDWNTRAFAAYQAKQFEDAALFWKYAAEVPNAGAINTAQALFNRAVTLDDLKRNEEAITTYDQVIETYRADLAPAIREQVAKALVNKGVTHGQMGDSDKAIATYDQVIETYRTDTAPAIREQVAKTLVNKGVTHGQMGDNDKAISTYEQVIETYRTDTAPAIREPVAKAMVNKGITHGQMGDNDQKIATYDQVIETYRTDSAPAIREQVAIAMVNKGFTHGQMGDNDKAIAAYDQVIETYRTDITPAIREQVAIALLNKGVTHGQMGDNDKAIATYEQIIETYRTDTAPAIREPVAKAMVNKGITHGQMGDNDQKITTYDQVIETYRTDTAPTIREQVAIAMNGRGFTRLIMAKQALANRNETEANELLNKAMADLLAAIEIKSQWGMALGNLAYTQWLLKHPAEAEAALRSALNSIEGGGEELYRGTQHDIAQHPIPEDAAFREMLDRLWSEYQAQRTNEN